MSDPTASGIHETDCICVVCEYGRENDGPPVPAGGTDVSVQPVASRARATRLGRNRRSIRRLLDPIRNRAALLASAAEMYAERHEATRQEMGWGVAERIDGLVFARQTLASDVPRLLLVAEKAAELAQWIGVEDAFWVADQRPRSEAERLAAELAVLMGLYWAAQPAAIPELARRVAALRAPLVRDE